MREKAEGCGHVGTRRARLLAALDVGPLAAPFLSVPWLPPLGSKGPLQQVSSQRPGWSPGTPGTGGKNEGGPRPAHPLAHPAKPAGAQAVAGQSRCRARGQVVWGLDQASLSSEGFCPAVTGVGPLQPSRSPDSLQPGVPHHLSCGQSKKPFPLPPECPQLSRPPLPRDPLTHCPLHPPFPVTPSHIPLPPPFT